MTGLNHAVTGALVAAAAGQPEIGLPAAFASHFAIDVIPHWNYKLPGGEYMKRLAMIMDLTLSLVFLLILSVTVNASPRLIIAGGLLGMAPDAFWLIRDFFPRTKKFYSRGWVKKLLGWHSRLQWSETGRGIYVEAAWLVLTLVLAYKFT